MEATGPGIEPELQLQQQQHVDLLTHCTRLGMETQLPQRQELRQSDS